MNKKALSLIELMITLALLAVVSAILIPRFIDIRKHALMQIAEDHAKTIEVALSAWTASQPSVAAAIANFGSSLNINNGYFMDAGACPTCTPRVIDFLDPSFIEEANLSARTVGTEMAYYTDQMKEIEGATFSNISINGTTVSPLSSLGHAHMRVIWPPYGVANQDTLRLSTHPTVVLFLPED